MCTGVEVILSLGVGASGELETRHPELHVDGAFAVAGVNVSRVE